MPLSLICHMPGGAFQRLLQTCQDAIEGALSLCVFYDHSPPAQMHTYASSRRAFYFLQRFLLLMHFEETALLVCQHVRTTLPLSALLHRRWTQVKSRPMLQLLRVGESIRLHMLFYTSVQWCILDSAYDKDFLPVSRFFTSFQVG